MEESAPKQKIQVGTGGVSPENATANKGVETIKDIPPPPKIRPTPENKKEFCRCKPDQTPLWKMALEAAVVFVGIYVAFVYSRQLTAMLDSNAINREALESVQRAYVSADSTNENVVVSDAKGVSTGVIFRVKLENSGTTPTRALTKHLSFQSRVDPLPSNFDFPDIWSKADHADAFSALGPKSQILLSTIPPIHRSVVEAASNKQVHIYLWGWAKYHDTFRNTPEHITEFCYEVIPFAQHPTAPQMKSFSVEFNQCERHNCVDEECEDYASKTH